jgi:hypothetical protein
VTFLQAAEHVLRSSKRPMTCREITDAALKQGLLAAAGKTPEASMSAVLYAVPRDGPIRREFEPGTVRAKRGSVRWRYFGSDR